MDPLFPAHILEDPDLRKLLNDSSMLNLSFLPTNWFNNSTGDSFLPLSIKITIVVVYSIVCIVGLVGNCSVMYVIVRRDEGSHQLSAALWCLLKFKPENGTERSDLLKKWGFLQAARRGVARPWGGQSAGSIQLPGCAWSSMGHLPPARCPAPSCRCCSVWELPFPKAESNSKGKDLLGGSVLLLQGRKQ